MAQSARLSADQISVAFDKSQVLNTLSVDIPDAKLTVIIGPNACGKSTLLRSLARLQTVGPGQTVLGGRGKV